ncbi:uncharacterized protein LOC124816160 [Hydra vulgaris]|uniref:uncharacterized protein LOC124816160 n=1 Tax=Hydra vulgaris TaxID=6087 RepID=UPI001F5FC846|nr:uncharacterized protein LOC124816160 [Hydra vulgaris]
MKNCLIIPEKIAEFMLPTTIEARTPLFYSLPKIHKENTPLRPIVSGCGSPTDNLSEYVVKYLLPIAESLPSYFKDSTELLKTLCETPLPRREYILVTADVVSLYTNIPHDDGIRAVSNFLNNNWKLLKLPNNLPPIIPTNHFCDLLKLILENSSFMFGSRSFHQKFGTSMGTRMAPPYANIFMGELDQKIIEKYKNHISLYKRFIDNVLLIFEGTLSELDELKTYMNSLHKNIKFTFDTSTKSVSFMDLTLTKNENNTISSTIYKKPTDTLSLLNFHSNHPRHQKIGIVYSQARRLNRLVSKEVDLRTELEKLAKTLVIKNYPIEVINQEINKALSSTQKNLIFKPITTEPISDKKKSFNNGIPIVLPYDATGKEIMKMTTKHWRIIQNDPVLSKILGEKPLKIYSNQKNLHDQLIRTKF